MILVIIPIVAIILILILSIWLFGWSNLAWTVKKWFHIQITQIRRNLSLSASYLLLLAVVAIPLLCLFRYFLKDVPLRDFLNLSYAGNSDSAIQVTTVTTTVFTTLMTVMLAFIALAVTAYVFLNDSLSNREDYERGVINTLKYKARRKLFVNCLLSGACIVACLVFDNTNLNIRKEWLSVFRYSVVAGSLFVIVNFILYLHVVVNYERRLLEYARSYIEYNQRDLCNNDLRQYKKESSESRNQYSKDPKELAGVIKYTSDIESMINSILQNHESEYRYLSGLTSEAMLGSVLSKNALPENEEILRKPICNRYYRLLEIRNCLWILQDAGEEILILNDLDDCARKLMEHLKTFAFKRERFVGLSLYNIDFSEGQFEQASLRDSALIDIHFENAKLKNCDFSNTLLENVKFDKADCSGAVFSDARIVAPQIDFETNFENAVFVNAEFTLEDDFTKEGTQKYNFKAISASRANFIGCKLVNCDFERAVFSEAQFDNSTFDRCSFKWADMTGAILVRSVIKGTNCFENANCSDVVAVDSIWGDDHSEPRLNLKGIRFAHCNMVGAKVQNCDFRQSYVNDTTFTDAAIHNCVFRSAFLANADFTNAIVSDTDFTNAILNNVLLVGEEQDGEKDTVRNVCFNKTDMNQCSIRNHIFRGCEFKYSILDNSVIRDTTFIDCDFTCAHFGNTMLFNVDWINCGGCTETTMDEVEFGTKEDRVNWGKVFANRE